ncbi:hypothetical protein [Paenibacillus sp. SYP-B4298]|uniref:hypothetical protein n=1 Tax=Paenibacillus sp. SYP-B4298 TaxID=2996034 RepID=UPI0022DD7F4C|nr:hypothetical protein [Paenibacillus sp. SYP-B4298]
MNIKKLATATLLGTALVVGSFSTHVVPANATQVQAVKTLVLQVGQSINAPVIIMINYDSAVGQTSTGGLKAIKPGRALVQIYENGSWVDYEIFVSQ